MAVDIRELSTMDATAQAELVRRKELTPLELVDAAIARIERINPTVNAVIGCWGVAEQKTHLSTINAAFRTADIPLWLMWPVRQAAPWLP